MSYTAGTLLVKSDRLWLKPLQLFRQNPSLARPHEVRLALSTCSYHPVRLSCPLPPAPGPPAVWAGPALPLSAQSTFRSATGPLHPCAHHTSCPTSGLHILAPATCLPSGLGLRTRFSWSLRLVLPLVLASSPVYPSLAPPPSPAPDS